MRVLYARISTTEQNSDRQTQKKSDYDYLIEDKCSGAIPFFERDGGKRILAMIGKNQISSLSVHAIDRIGRDLKDILHTIDFFNKKGICIHIVQQSMKTLNDDGTENPISKMIISILGVVAEMERNFIKERQLEGISIAKAKGIYKGRQQGTKTSVLDFLNKKKNKIAVERLKLGLKKAEVAKITGLHVNTITKISKVINKIKEH